MIRAGDQKSIILTYSPTTEAQHAGTVTLSVDAAGQANLTASLKGRGEYQCTTCAPVINTDSNHALTDFFVLSGLSNDERPVTIQNTGDQPLVINSIQVNNDSFFPEGWFTVSGFNSAVTLDPGQAMSFSVVFEAANSGMELDLSFMDENVIHILSNATNEPDYLITLSGIAL